MNFRNISIVFCLALALRLLYLGVLTPGPEDLKKEDQQMYRNLAATMIETGGFNRSISGQLVIPETERVPGYIAFLAGFRLLNGEENPYHVLVVQSVIDSLTCVGAAILVAEFMPGSFLTGGILAAINLNMIILAGLMLTDSLFLFFFTILHFISIRYAKKPTLTIAAAIGLTLGLATLTRSMALFFAPAIVLFIILVGLRVRQSIVKTVGELGICLLLLALFVTPLMYRNYQQFGFFKLTSQGGTHAMGWVVPMVMHFSEGMPFEEAQQLLGEKFNQILTEQKIELGPETPFIINNLRMQVAKEQIKEIAVKNIVYAWMVGTSINLAAPSLIFAPAVRNIERPGFYSTPGETPTRKILNFLINSDNLKFLALIIPALITTLVFIALKMCGFFVLLKDKKYDWLQVGYLLMVIVFVFGITGPIPGVKYRLPVETVLTVFCVVGIDFLRRFWLKKNRWAHTSSV